MPKPTIDLTGRKFGRLTVLGRGEDATRKNGRHDTTFICQCDCGNVTQVMASRLKNGCTQSCGCIHREFIGSLNKKHGQTNTRLYAIWERMRARCNNENTKEYPHYGGRGIRVCDEWDDFEVFREWALQAGYTDKLTIDRIDNSAGYCPNNCRWATMTEQANNKRNNHLITLNGKTQTLAQWVKETGIKRDTIKKRIKYGWSIEDALTKPVKKGKTMKVKVRLDTLSDIKGFVNVVSPIADEVHLTDGNNLTVSAKSILGAMYTMEWSEVYCTCDKDIYSIIRTFIVEE